MYKKDIKLMAFVMSAMFWGSWAYANEVYVEQIGDNTNVTILQDGNGNKIDDGLGGNAYIGGDNNVVGISQIGSNNTLNLSVNSLLGGMSITSNVTGDDNNQVIQCGSSNSASCNASTIIQDITGNSNNVSTLMTGSGTYSSNVSVTGNYNNVTHTQSGAGAHTGTIIVNSSGTSSTPNIVNLTQSGINAKTATITTTNASGNISVTQSD
jgi:hypothetical protein